MTGTRESAKADLPELWCRRLFEVVRAAEEQIVIRRHRAGDGLERLVARWSSEGLVVALRGRDLQSADALITAIESAQHSADWFAAIGGGEGAAVAALRSALRPGQRLLVLDVESRPEEPPEAGATAAKSLLAEFESGSKSVSLDPELRPSEVQDWARRRWSRDLSADVATKLVASCAGEMRAVEEALERWHHRLDSGEVEEAGGGVTDPPLEAPGDLAFGTRTPAGPWVDLKLLGVPSIRWAPLGSPNSPEELRWGYRGVLEVLAALAVAPQMRLPRNELLERLWPNLETGEARKRLYPAISHARRLFAHAGVAEPSAIESAAGVYRLNPRWRWNCDVRRLREAVRQSDHISDDLMEVQTGSPGQGASEISEASEPAPLRTVLERAWSSYRGDFLETLRSRWVRAEREEQRRHYLVVLRRLAALRHADAETIGLEDVLRTILVADPIAEDAHVALMRLYSRRGRADLVRRQFDRMCSVLMDDLGLQPMDRTVQEVERLVAS